MIITKTPYRISFFGGGTDHPTWFKENGGKVLATSFDKYCYISVRNLPQFFDHKFRIVYSIIESVKTIDQIKHPSVRETLNYLNINRGLEIHHDGDLPARAGLGSSSSFTVGLINAINALRGVQNSKLDLANSAIHIEQNLINECVGSQDQISAAYGGMNQIIFKQDGSFLVDPMILSQDRKNHLNDHLMLFYSGVSRFASDISKSQVSNMKKVTSQMHDLYSMVDEGSSILNNLDTSLDEFGKLLHESWKIKRSLSNKISNSLINDIYEAARGEGAIGGKVLGAGGGGFILLFVRPEDQKAVKSKLKNLVYVPFKFENMGSKVALYQPSGL
jgi:D-glycero-alpha-D-manno-heptose-7-phosphate kinase